MSHSALNDAQALLLLMRWSANAIPSARSMHQGECGAVSRYMVYAIGDKKRGAL
jgi:hypothetical protein